MYAAQGAKASRHQTVVQAALRVPHGVVCLLSALRFHDLTTRSPFEIWLAIDVKARAPKEDIILLRIVRFSGKALASGVDHHTITTSDELWRYAKICRVARVMRPYLEAVV